MIELKKDSYNIAVKLFEGIPHSIPIVFSVLDGNAPGKVFVDNTSNPSTVFLYPEDCYFYIIGDHTNDSFNKSLVDMIFKEILPKTKGAELIIFSFSLEWESKLNILLSDTSSIKIKRIVYSFNEELFNKYKIDINSKVDKYTLEKIDESNIDCLDLHSWVSNDLFLKNGLGYIIKDGDNIVSTCYSVYAGRNNLEIDIATHESYRGKGYASYVAKAFIEECLLIGKIPNWSCWPQKKASMHIAKKLGFDNERVLSVHFWSPEL